MEKNILIVDDSALMRRVISDIISSDSRFKVMDIAVNGLEAFDLVTRKAHFYDAVLLDINMPKMNGIEFLEQVSRLKIRLKVIVVSTMAKEGADETIKCLELGAFDFVTKPDSFIDARSDSFSRRIIEVLSAATGQEQPVHSKTYSENAGIQSHEGIAQNDSHIHELYDLNAKVVRKPHRPVMKTARKLVALACSTGGPKALQCVIPLLPGNLDAPVIIVQHMPMGFTKSLADRLNELSKVHVKEAEDGDVIKKGWVYIAQGGKQMRLVKKAGSYVLTETAEQARNGLRPCADIMYESLQGMDIDEITCVVLTGMGADGTLGIKGLNEKNNIFVISQDEKTSTVYGMPRMIHEVGLSDEVVPLESVADAIAKNVGLS